jgi:hypothetical protein
VALGHPFVNAQFPIDASIELSAIIDEDIEAFVSQTGTDSL